MDTKSIKLPNEIMGKSLKFKVIPTVCNLKNMLLKLREINGDISQLKQWEKRSYKAYNIQAIKKEILKVEENELPSLIRQHILMGDKNLFGASCIDIYLVGYVSHEMGVGKEIFTKYILSKEITRKMNSVNAIWTVGRGDGVYLRILNEDGSIKDMGFIKKWVKR